MNYCDSRPFDLFTSSKNSRVLSNVVLFFYFEILMTHKLFIKPVLLSYRNPYAF